MFPRSPHRTMIAAIFIMSQCSIDQYVSVAAEDNCTNTTFILNLLSLTSLAFLQLLGTVLSHRCSVFVYTEATIFSAYSGYRRHADLG